MGIPDYPETPLILMKEGPENLDEFHITEKTQIATFLKAVKENLECENLECAVSGFTFNGEKLEADKTFGFYGITAGCIIIAEMLENSEDFNKTQQNKT